MTRPQKNNAEYFSHDSDMRDDPRIKAVRKNFKHTGYSIWNMLLEYLTDCENFEFEYSELTMELLSGDFDIEIEELKRIFEYLLKLKLIVNDNGTIYSIQHKKRFESLISKRKRERKGVIADDNTQSKEENRIEETNIIISPEEIEKSKNPPSSIKDQEKKEDDDLPTNQTNNNTDYLKHYLPIDLNKFSLMSDEEKNKRLHAIYDRLISQEAWIISIYRQLQPKIKSKEMAVSYITKFCNELNVTNNYNDSIDKIKAHCFNWIRKQLEKEYGT